MRIFKIITFLILLAVLFFLAVYFNVYPLFVFALVLILFMALDVLLFIIPGNISVDIGADKTQYKKGCKGAIKLSVRNKCFYPVGKVKLTISVKNRFYSENKLNYIFSIGVLAKKAIRIPFNIKCSGIYDIKIAEIEYSDMFSIFSKKTLCENTYSFVVMPSENNVTASIIGEADTENIPTENVYSANNGDISGFREYKEGDRLSNINWKLSARMNVPYVREFERASMDEAVIVLDMYCKGLDKALDNLYSIVSKEKNFYIFWLPAGAEEFENRYISDDETAYNMFLDIFCSAPDIVPDRGINEYIRLYKGHKFLYIDSKGSSVV